MCSSDLSISNTHDAPNATMAVYLDLENIAIGARDARYPTFSVEKVFERLYLRGHIVVKKAYCDFSRYKEFKHDLHDSSFELIEIPHFRQSGKNSADINGKSVAKGKWVDLGGRGTIKKKNNITL